MLAEKVAARGTAMSAMAEEMALREAGEAEQRAQIASLAGDTAAKAKVRCCVLQRVVLCCGVLRCVAVCCSVLHCVCVYIWICICIYIYCVCVCIDTYIYIYIIQHISYIYHQYFGKLTSTLHYIYI